MIVAALLFAKAIVDAVSLVDQGAAATDWTPFALELTSAAFFAATLWPLWQISRRLRPPQLGWPAAIAAHIGLTLPLVLAHAVWLAASRAVVFSLLGDSYSFDWSWRQLVFEWRKDTLAFAALAALGWVLDRLFSARESPIIDTPYRLAVKNGVRTLMIAAHEISHASSAGNYVELATTHGNLLHRSTLSTLAEELEPHGFVRIHRAHLVRIAAVAAVTSEGSGDFAVTMTDGKVLPGSRRWRGALAKLGR